MKDTALFLIFSAEDHDLRTASACFVAHVVNTMSCSSGSKVVKE
jgi:hypothetical protein